METFTMSRKEAPRPGLLRQCLAGRLTNSETAAALRLSVRQVQRLKQAFKRGGVRALLHRLRGRESNRRLSQDRVDQVRALMTTTYAGFNDRHFTEKLHDVERIPISRASVQRLRVALGRPAQRPRRPVLHRSRRPRADAVGRLVQVDGSPFAWLEDRGPALTLVGAIDDASSAILALHFRPTEDLHGYLVVLDQLLRHHGVPVALYGDRLNVFVRNDRHWTVTEELAGVQSPTHFGRALADLGVAYIAAQSPQGKGRIERLWGTLQDRLVSELRLRGVRTMAEANAFLPAFITTHNRRFAAAAASLPTAWRTAPRHFEHLLGCRYTRLVARDNTVRLGPRWVQLPPGRYGRSWAGRRLEVRELVDGRLLVIADNTIIATGTAPLDFVLRPRQLSARALRPPHDDRPQPATARGIRSTRRPVRLAPTRPAHDHPWLVSIRRHLARKEARTRTRG
jgi:hypothetical protein